MKKTAALTEPPSFQNEVLSPTLYPEQHADHTDQHADNQQGGGIVLEIVHGKLSFSCADRRLRLRLSTSLYGHWTASGGKSSRKETRVKGKGHIFRMRERKDFPVDIARPLCYHT